MTFIKAMSIPAIGLVAGLGLFASTALASPAAPANATPATASALNVDHHHATRSSPPPRRLQRQPGLGVHRVGRRRDEPGATGTPNGSELVFSHTYGAGNGTAFTATVTRLLRCRLRHPQRGDHPPLHRQSVSRVVHATQPLRLIVETETEWTLSNTSTRGSTSDRTRDHLSGQEVGLRPQDQWHPPAAARLLPARRQRIHLRDDDGRSDHLGLGRHHRDRPDRRRLVPRRRGPGSPSLEATTAATSTTTGTAPTTAASSSTRT